LLVGHFPIENGQYIYIWIIHTGYGPCVLSDCPLTALTIDLKGVGN